MTRFENIAKETLTDNSGIKRCAQCQNCAYAYDEFITAYQKRVCKVYTDLEPGKPEAVKNNHFVCEYFLEK